MPDHCGHKNTGYPGVGARALSGVARPLRRVVLPALLTACVGVLFASALGAPAAAAVLREGASTPPTVAAMLAASTRTRVTGSEPSVVPAVVTHETKGKVLALTFDDGPDPRFTPKVLAILRAKKVHATFFMVGNEVERHPELAVQAWADGNEIGNHTYTHPDMTKLGWAGTVAEISMCQDVLENVTGVRPKYFRPPKGEFDSQDVEAARAMGYKLVMWTVGLENHAMKTKEAMVDRVCAHVKSGSLVLIHDGRLDRSRSVAALPLLIDRLQAQGYTLVTVSQLLVATGQASRDDLDVIDLHKHFPLTFAGPLMPGKR